MKCSVDNCERDAFLLAYTKWMCGECFLRIKAKLDKEMWERINDGSN